MRFLCAALCAAFLSTAAVAAELKEGKDWRYCSLDEQCVMIDGLCGKTAVNVLARDRAILFYKQEAAKVKCVKNFWAPKERVVRCYMGGCDTRPKQASDEAPATK